MQGKSETDPRVLETLRRLDSLANKHSDLLRALFNMERESQKAQIKMAYVIDRLARTHIEQSEIPKEEVLKYLTEIKQHFDSLRDLYKGLGRDES